MGHLGRVPAAKQDAVEVPGARGGAALQPHALPSRVSRSQAGPGSGHAGGEGGNQGGDEEEGGGIQTSWRRFRTAKDFQVNYHVQSYFKRKTRFKRQIVSALARFIDSEYIC